MKRWSVTLGTLLGLGAAISFNLLTDRAMAPGWLMWGWLGFAFGFDVLVMGSKKWD